MLIKKYLTRTFGNFFPSHKESKVVGIFDASRIICENIFIYLIEE